MVTPQGYLGGLPGADPPLSNLGPRNPAPIHENLKKGDESLLPGTYGDKASDFLSPTSSGNAEPRPAAGPLFSAIRIEV
jgi:hypothetical protein